MNPLSAFLRNVAIFLVAVISTTLPYSCDNKAPVVKLDAGEFANPSREFNVHTWWHWMDGAITREGITRDLESMKQQGVSQATILNIGLFNGKDFGVPQVKFNTDEWYGMFKWALQEASRLDIKIGAHNCDGWSTSGGPWITPELSMKQYTWTKNLVQGGKMQTIHLKQPKAENDFYRDVAVVAFPDLKYVNSFREASPAFILNDADETGVLSDGNPVSAVKISRGDRVKIIFKTEFTAEKIAIHPRKTFMWRDMTQFRNTFILLASENGQDYKQICDITTLGANSSFVFDIPETTSKYFMIELKDESSLDAYYDFLVGEIELLKQDEFPLYSPVIPYHMEKTVSSKAADYGHFNETGDPGQEEVNLSPDDIIDLTGLMKDDGLLDWEVPEGNWIVVRFGYTTTGKTNGPATPEGTGLECDKMDKAALDIHFDNYARKLADHSGEHLGNTFKFLLIDSWECQYQNWSDRFGESFEANRGYSIIPWIPVLCGETIGNTDLSEGFIYDFRKTIAELIENNYYRHFKELCQASNLEMHAEVIYGHTNYPPLDILKTNSYVDLPMFEFWAGAHPEKVYPQYDPTERPVVDLPAHACAGYGMPVLGAEAYTGYAHYSESPVNLKSFGDRAFCSGINQMILHSYVHQPAEKKPGMTLGGFAAHFNRNNPWWNQVSGWMEYHARIQYVLQKGSVVSDVLFYLGDQLPQSAGNSYINDLPYGYRAAACNYDLLQNRMKVENGKIILSDSQEYSLLVMPDQDCIEPATLRRIAMLVEEGAAIYGPKPEKMLSLAAVQNDEDDFLILVEELWGEIDGSEITENQFGEGRIFWGMPLEEVLGQLEVEPQFTTNTADPLELMYIHKNVAGDDVFFVFNQQDHALDLECLFRTSGNLPEIWDPVDGSVVNPSQFNLEDGRVRIPVRFKPGEALLFIISKGEKMPDTSSESPEIIEIGDIEGVIEFQPSYDETISNMEISELKPLTDFEEEEIKYFAGTANYSIKFAIPEGFNFEGHSIQLDVGNIEAIAEITLNGQKLGIAWLPGMSFDVTGMLQDENQLEVVLTTTFRNRIIGDYREFGELRNVWTSAPVENYLSAETELKPTGLIGPLRLIKSPAPE
jgi:hypothetical protein